MHPIKRFKTGELVSRDDFEWNPQILYHYTTRDGLIAILCSGIVWATSIRFLNDSSEYRYAQTMFKQKLKEMRTRLPAEHTAWIDQALRHIPSAPDLFVFCLSTKGDQLSQWRAYGQPGNGYSIGFDAPALDQIIRKRGMQLAKVCYSPKQQWELLNRIESSAVRKSQATGKGNALSFAGALREMFLDVGPIMKDPAFIEEDEWRLLLRLSGKSNDPPVRHRAGRSMLVPYVSLALKRRTTRMPICSITVGPNTHPALDKEAVKGLCKQFGIEAKIFNSDIPFRAL